MKQFGGGGFLGLGLDNTFRAMTAATPIQDAVNLAHRAARQRLEAGGTAAPDNGTIPIRKACTTAVRAT